MIVRVLGPTEIVMPTGVVELPSVSQRRLLAALASAAPTAVRLDWFCWTFGVSSGAVRTTVARLRRLAGNELIHTTTTGYRLGVPVDATIACRELARSGGDPDVIALALGRWVGPAFYEFREEMWAHGEAARLAEVYATAVEDRAEALIAARRSDEAIAALESHVRSHAFRDRPQGLIIRALAASGRQTEALRRFQEYRTFLAESAGTEPTSELRRIEQRVAAGWDGVGDAARTVAPRRSRSSRPVPAGLASTPTIVGRSGQLAVLAGAADAAQESTPQVVLVEGEAGIGKTSLIAEFVRGLDDSLAWRVMYGRCDEFIGEPFQPFRDIVGRLAEELPDDVLTAHAALFGGDLARLVPALRERLPAALHDLSDDQATVRHFLFQAVVDVVRRSVDRDPLLLVVDDLHWAERTGLQLLVHVVREVVGLPLLVIAGYRDTGEDSSGELRTATADLVRLGAHRITLTGLDETELAALVHSRVPDSAGLAVGGVAARLASETAGNPLFAEHLLGHWSDSASIAFEPDGLRLIAAHSAPSPTIRDLVVRRVAVLGPTGRDVLSAAAVLGTEFEESIVASMTGVDPAELDDVFDRALESGLVVGGGARGTPSHFTHAVVARSLEAELGDRQRSRLHSAAFDALCTVPAVAPSRLAHHAERAGRVADSLHWATAAGSEAMSNLAASEAVGWFRRALSHGLELARPDAERAELLVRLGEAEYRAGSPTGLDTLHEAAVLAERCGADDVLVRAAMAIDPGSMVRFGRFAPQQLAIAEAAVARTSEQDAATRARVGAVLAQSLIFTDQVERRHATATASLELARASGDPAVIVRVASDALIALWTPGTGAMRCAIAEEASAFDELLTDPSLSATFAHGAFAAAVCAGDASTAQRYRARFVAIADELDEPRARWMATILEAFDATMSCRFRDAERSIAAALDIGTRLGESEAFTIFAGQSFVLGAFEGRHAELLPLVEQMLGTLASPDLSFRAAHAILCVEVGRPAPAQQLLYEVFERGLEGIPNDFVRSTTLLGYAVLALELGDVTAAAALLTAIEPLTGEVSFNGISSQGPIAGYAGKLLTLLGRHDEAERYLLAALATTEAFGWEYHRATTLLALAQNRAAASSFDGLADAWLSTATALCEQYGLGIWARRAGTLREQFAAERR